MIKNLVSILSGTVLAGLINYAILELSGRLDLMGATGRMTLPIWLFVFQMALVGLLAGSLTLLLLRLLRNEDEREHDKLSRRIQDLESRQ